MHEPGFQIQIAEFLSHVPSIAQFDSYFSSCTTEMTDVIMNLNDKKECNPIILECVLMKEMIEIWRSMSIVNFASPLRQRKNYGNIEGDSIFENPRIPDYLLSDLSRDRIDSSKLISQEIFPLTGYNDRSLKAKGMDSMIQLLKLIVFRDRLLFSWIETEFWRKVVDNQYKDMRLKKSIYTGRLGQLRFEMQREDEVQVNENSDDEGGDHGDIQVNEVNSTAKKVRNLRFGPLAICEIDERQIISDFEDGKEFLAHMKGGNMSKISLAVRAQLIEKNWFMGAAELQSLILHEIHKEHYRQDVHLLLFPLESKSKAFKSRLEDDKNFQSDVDYRLLVPSNLNKKKLIRKAMLSEFAKEYKTLLSLDYSDKNLKTSKEELKVRLMDWYYDNMEELAIEEVERAEFAKLVIRMNLNVYSDSYGLLNFVPSKIESHSDFFKNSSEKGESMNDVTKQTSKTQNLIFSDVAATRVLCDLWYTPHLSEILLKLSVSDSSSNKQVSDISRKLYTNSFVFQKSYQVHALLFQTYNLIRIYARLLQSSQRYSAHGIYYFISVFNQTLYK